MSFRGIVLETEELGIEPGNKPTGRGFADEYGLELGLWQINWVAGACCAVFRFQQAISPGVGACILLARHAVAPAGVHHGLFVCA